MRVHLGQYTSVVACSLKGKAHLSSATIAAHAALVAHPTNSLGAAQSRGDPTAVRSHSRPFSGPHLCNPCKYIYRSWRDGRLNWHSWLTHIEQFTHKVVTCQT